MKTSTRTIIHWGLLLYTPCHQQWYEVRGSPRYSTFDFQKQLWVCQRKALLVAVFLEKDEAVSRILVSLFVYLLDEFPGPPEHVLLISLIERGLADRSPYQPSKGTIGLTLSRALYPF